MSQHHLSLRAKLIIMLSVMASLFLVALDQTIVSTALGKIVEDLNAYSSLSWIVTAYLLTTTVTVPIAGKLSDLFGRRILLLVGVAVFAVASLFCGLADNVTSIVIWRAVQGIGGGIITANAFTIIGDLFAARERGRWQGLFGAVFGISSVIGPLLGGWLTDNQTIFGLETSWHWIFWINVPIAIAAFAMIAIICPPLKHAKKARIDYSGAAFLTLALSTLVLSVDNTEQIFSGVLEATGWTLMTLRIVMWSIVALATGLFIRSQRRADEPIMPLRLFANRNYTLLMGVATLFGAGFMGSIIYLTQFNQQVFGASPTESGLMMIPMVIGIMSASIGSGQIISRVGRYKIFMKIGIVLVTIMVAALTTLTPESTYLQEAVIMVLLGVGMGLVMPVMTIAVQNEFSYKDLGVATSSIQLFRGLGSTIGIALFGALLTAGLSTQLSGVEDSKYVSMLRQNPAIERTFGSLDEPDTLLTLNMPDPQKIIRDKTLGAIEAAPIDEATKQQQTKDFLLAQAEYQHEVTEAFSKSLQQLFTISTLIIAPGIVLVFSMRERKLRSASPEATPGEA